MGLKSTEKDVRVIDETFFPIELMANDPTAKGIIDNLGVALDEMKEVANSVASIKVFGVKPSKTN
jgi:hypothetical protein